MIIILCIEFLEERLILFGLIYKNRYYCWLDSELLGNDGLIFMLDEHRITALGV